MSIDVFAEAKRLVSAKDAAHFYNLRFDSKDKSCLCPFHNDHKPSMGFYQSDNGDIRYHCFSCKADGSCIDLVMGLYGLDATDALKRLIADFHLPLSVGKPQSARERKQARDAWEKRQRAAAVRDALSVWVDRETDKQADTYRTGHLALKGIETLSDFDHLTPEQVKAVWMMPQVEYTSNELLSGNADRILAILERE